MQITFGKERRMKVSTLLAQLEELSPDDEIELFHEVYCGGGDEARFEEPVLIVGSNGRIYLTASWLVDNLKYEVGEVESIVNLAGIP